MHHSRPGEMRSFTLSMFASVILSPTATSARAGGASIVAVTASAAASLRVVVIGPPSLEAERPETLSRAGIGSERIAFGESCEGRAAAGQKGAANTDAVGQSV